MSSADMAITITGSSLVKLPEHRFAILLVGHRGSHEPYSETFEVTHEALNLLRTEILKAERCLDINGGVLKF